MKNKLIILLILIIAITGLSIENDTFNFNKKGFSYNINNELKNEMDLDLYSKDKILIYKILFLNFYQEEYTTNATSLFEENINTDFDRKISINYFLDFMFMGDLYKSSNYAELGVIIKNEALFKKYTQFQGLNHEIKINGLITNYVPNLFYENNKLLNVVLNEGISYDFKNIWTYTKLKTNLEYNKEFKGFYIRPENNFETVLFESNPEKKYYLPKISLKNTVYNLSVNNYMKNKLEIGYAIDSEFKLPMKTRIGIFGETLFYSDKLQDLFTENLNGFAGVNIIHIITDKEVPSIFEIELGAGKYFTKTKLSEKITPYFNIKFNLTFIGTILRMF